MSRASRPMSVTHVAGEWWCALSGEGFWSVFRGNSYVTARFRDERDAWAYVAEELVRECLGLSQRRATP
jgi:hypothetical protein